MYGEYRLTLQVRITAEDVLSLHSYSLQARKAPFEDLELLDMGTFRSAARRTLLGAFDAQLPTINERLAEAYAKWGWQAHLL